RGQRPANYRRLVDQVLKIVHALGAAGFGHSDLHLGNFLLHDEKLFLLDAYAIHRGGLRKRDVLMLGHSAARFATTSDLIRGWQQLGGGALPAGNKVSATLYRKFLATTRGENQYYGLLPVDGVADAVNAGSATPPTKGWRGH